MHITNHSCIRFPVISSNGMVNKVDIEKLQVAVDNSSIIVSAFCIDTFCDDKGEEEVRSVEKFGLEHLLERALPMIPTEEEKRLIGFGRAVSDGALSASIHDVVVNPSLQRMGIGRKIIEIITSYLTGKGIYDIAALCSEEESHFFKACGFGKDYLGATTMMYTRTATTEQDLNVKSFGKMTLFVPPFIKERIQNSD